MLYESDDLVCLHFLFDCRLICRVHQFLYNEVVKPNSDAFVENREGTALCLLNNAMGCVEFGHHLPENLRRFK